MWASVVMGFSRTGWIGLVVSLGIVAWKARSRGVLKRIGVGLATLVLTIAFFFVTDVKGVGGELPVQFAFRLRQGWDLVASLTGLFETSSAFEDQFNESEQRADVWPEYWTLFLANPLTGAGLGVGWETNSVGQEPHNLFLELGAETGVLGLAAFLGLMTVIVRTGKGPIGGIALVVSLLPVVTQTVLFEPSWWFAAGLFLARTGKFEEVGEIPLESLNESGVVTPEQSAA
jgi:O-antigen ligase